MLLSEVRDRDYVCWIYISYETTKSGDQDRGLPCNQSCPNRTASKRRPQSASSISTPESIPIPLRQSAQPSALWPTGSRAEILSSRRNRNSYDMDAAGYQRPSLEIAHLVPVAQPSEPHSAASHIYCTSTSYSHNHHASQYANHPPQMACVLVAPRRLHTHKPARLPNDRVNYLLLMPRAFISALFNPIPNLIFPLD